MPLCIHNERMNGMINYQFLRVFAQMLPQQSAKVHRWIIELLIYMYVTISCGLPAADDDDDEDVCRMYLFISFLFFFSFHTFFFPNCVIFLIKHIIVH